jgi:quercetin dioxygenase-like cupin family protein
MALHHAKPGEPVRLASLGTEHSAALVKTDQFEAIHLVVPGGHSLAPHRVSGQFTLHCLTGRVNVSLTGAETIVLNAGDWLYLDRAKEHGVEALEDSTLLLTILF